MIIITEWFTLTRCVDWHWWKGCPVSCLTNNWPRDICQDGRPSAILNCASSSRLILFGSYRICSCYRICMAFYQSKIPFGFYLIWCSLISQMIYSHPNKLHSHLFYLKQYSYPSQFNNRLLMFETVHWF